MKESQITTTIKRNFIDNYKKNFDIYGAINAFIKDYFVDINHQLTMLYSIDTEDQIFINGIVDDSPHDLKYNKLMDRNQLDKLDYGNLVQVFTESARGQEAVYQPYINYYYKRDFNLSLYSNVDNIRILNLNGKDFTYRFYDLVIVKLLPYLYKRIAQKILSILKLDPNEYSIQFTKVFDDNKEIHGEKPTHKYSTKYLPFLSSNIYALYNYITNDIRPMNIIKNSIFFPFSDKILLGRIGERYNGTLSDYSYAHTPIIDDLRSELFPSGYYTNNIMIGNLCNNLHINITHNDTNQTVIIAYNDIGINPKIIHNIISINSVSRNLCRNIEDIIDPKESYHYNELIKEHDSLLCKVHEERTTAIKAFEKNFFMAMMQFLKEQYYTESYYNNRIAKNKVIAPNETSIAPFVFKIKSRNMDYNMKLTVMTKFNNGVYEYLEAFKEIYLQIITCTSNLMKPEEFFNEKLWERMYSNISHSGYYHHPITFRDINDVIYKFKDTGYIVRVMNTPQGNIAKSIVTNDYPEYYSDQCQYDNKIGSPYVTNNFILIRDYICNFFIEYCKENLKLITDPYCLPIMSKISKVHKEITKMRNSFKNKKLEYFNNMPTMGNNINSTDITLEANYYNSNMQLVSTPFYNYITKEE